MILIIMILLFKTYIYIERQMYNQKDMSLCYNTICVYQNLMHLTYTEFNSLKASETSEAIRICNVIKNKQIATSDLLTFGTYTSNYMFLFVTNVLERAPNKEECQLVYDGNIEHCMRQAINDLVLSFWTFYGALV